MNLIWTPDDPFEYIEEFNSTDCCNLHYLPTDNHSCCEDHVRDTGPGILMKACTNCWYYNDRMKKYGKLVDCKWCGNLTVNKGTKECDRCWELRHRIEMDPELANKIYRVVIEQEEL